MILGLTPLGFFHTLISLVAVAAGAYALFRDRKITWDNQVGKLYVITTLIVCITGFGIFQHGGFGNAHVLGVLTLIVIVIAFLARKNINAFGRLSPYIETVSFSLTFFFHIVPAITETATRLPVGMPIASSPEDPIIQGAVGVCFLLFVVGAVVQVRRMRTENRE